MKSGLDVKSNPNDTYTMQPSGLERKREVWFGPEPASGVVTLVVFAAALAPLLLMLPFRDYVTDDTYIHLQFAKNFLAGRGLSFNGGDPTYGFTSPLWLLSIAVLGRLGLDLLFAAKLLGALFTSLSVMAVFEASREMIDDPRARVGVTLAWACNAWALRWGLSGMETPMVVCFAVLGIAYHLRERRRALLPLGSGTCWALAILTRPETIVLPMIAALDLFAFEPKARRARVIALIGTVGVLVAPWLYIARTTFGTILPNSVEAKAGIWLDPSELGTLLWRLGKLVGATQGGEVVILALAVGYALVRRRRWIQESLSRFSLPWIWICVLPGLFLIRNVLMVSRYELPALPILSLLAFGVLGRLDRPRWLASAVVLFAIQNLVVLYVVTLPHTRSFTAGIENSLVYIGEWAERETAPTASIASPDIGVLGYLSDRRIIDLSGLVTPAMVPLYEERKIAVFVESLDFEQIARPDYVVDRFPAPNRFAEGGEFSEVFEPLFARRIGPLGIARTWDFHYTVYRMHWDRYDEILGRKPKPARD